MSQKPRVLSGIQPTNTPNIGNYIGAMQQWVRLQETHECFFCIVDLHAITVRQNPRTLHENIRKLAAFYIAAGVDPENSVIFVQSRVSAHAELAWILNTLVKISELERMTQFKDKAVRHRENVNMGLFGYPVLMAADILLYSPDAIPVGEDQAQHVELARTLAQRFNKQFGEVLTIPRLQLQESGARIMGLDDPEKKMSKSAASQWNYVALDDDPALIRKKIQKAVTDSGTNIVFDPTRAGLYNLLTIYRAFSGESEGVIEKRFQDAGYGDFKKALGDLLVEQLSPLQEKYFSLMKDSTRLDSILNRGMERANVTAGACLQEVYKAVGLG